MKRLGKFITVGIAVGLCQLTYADTTTLKSQTDKLSYTMGYHLAQGFKDHGVALNSDMVRQGILDVMQGKHAALTDAQMKETLASFQQQMLSKQMEKMKTDSVKNKKEGDAFLAQNKKKPGVITLNDGLQYRVLQAGHGPKPKVNDNVVVEYKGSNVKGEVFDQSSKPVTMNVSEVIPGWTRILQMMPSGSIWEVAIPPSQAYGEQGVPNSPIGPNETLLFKIKLHAVAKDGDQPGLQHHHSAQPNLTQ